MYVAAIETNTDADLLAPYAAAVKGTLLVWPVIGVLAGTFLATFYFDVVALRIAATALYVIGVFAVVGWQIRKSGVQPSFKMMPAVLKRNMVAFWLAGTLMIGIAITVAMATNFLVAGVVVGLATTLVGVIYHLRSRALVDSLLAAL